MTPLIRRRSRKTGSGRRTSTRGGAPEDLRNVWPEPKGEAKRKDEVEDALVAAVCYQHTLTLLAAQAAIARDWTATTAGLPPIRHHHYAEDNR